MMRILLVLFFLPLCLFGDIAESLREHIPYDTEGENLFGVIKVEKDRPINQATYIQVKFALEDFVEKGVKGVILHLDTPGGEVLSSLKITRLLKEFDRDHHIPVIAFIDNWAVSAGAMLAYSCRFIATTPESIMGAAEPVLIKGSKRETASEKENSALRAEFNNLAVTYGRNPLIAEAMVDKSMLLVKRGSTILDLQSDSDIERGDLVISKKGKLLTLNAKELVTLGVSDWETKPGDLFSEGYLSTIPNVKMVSYKNWRISFFSFLTHPIVMSILSMGLILGIYIEFSTPGFGIAGSIALASLSLILLASFAVHTVNVLEMIMLGVGVVLLLLELFVIPGFGVTGILGIVLIAASLVILMIPGISEIDFSNLDSIKLVGEGVLERLAYLLSSFIVSLILIVIFARFFSKKLLSMSRLVLKGEEEKSKGFVSNIEDLPSLGVSGTAMSSLSPAGKVEIDGTLFDAMSDGAFIEKGAQVVVTGISEGRVVVSKKE